MIDFDSVMNLISLVELRLIQIVLAASYLNSLPTRTSVSFSIKKQTSNYDINFPFTNLALIGAATFACSCL